LVTGGKRGPYLWPDLNGKKEERVDRLDAQTWEKRSGCRRPLGVEKKNAAGGAKDVKGIQPREGRIGTMAAGQREAGNSSVASYKTN